MSLDFSMAFKTIGSFSSFSLLASSLNSLLSRLREWACLSPHPITHLHPELHISCIHPHITFFFFFYFYESFLSHLIYTHTNTRFLPTTHKSYYVGRKQRVQSTIEVSPTVGEALSWTLRWHPHVTLTYNLAKYTYYIQTPGTLVKAEILDALSMNARVYYAKMLECDLPWRAKAVLTLSSALLAASYCGVNSYSKMTCQYLWAQNQELLRDSLCFNLGWRMCVFRGKSAL